MCRIIVASKQLSLCIAVCVELCFSVSERGVLALRVLRLFFNEEIATRKKTSIGEKIVIFYEYRQRFDLIQVCKLSYHIIL